MEWADVVHIASHATADPRLPGRVLLQLGFALPGDFGLLRKFSDQDGSVNDGFGALKRVPSLVVLAACQSARGPLMRGELGLGPASPFLAAGIRGIVATLWDVSDTDTMRFVVSFHNAIRLGELVPDALEAARGAGRMSGMPIESWAAFVAIVQ